VTRELFQRIAFTLGALLLYRLGTYIPLPGIDPNIWEQIFQTQRGAALGWLNLTSGGSIHRLAIFALNIVPYVAAAIILQLAMIVSRRLRALRKLGEHGRRVMERYTLSLAALLAAFQAYGIASALEGVRGVVANPGWLFLLSTVITLTGGTLLLAWLSQQITLRGIGNGIALVLFAGIVTELPADVARTLELSRQGVLSSNALPTFMVIVVVVTAFIVLMERARRQIPIRFAAREGARLRESRSDLSLKLNSAGVIPVILASWFLVVPVALTYFAGGQRPTWLEQGHLLYLIVYGTLIVLCAFLYTAFVLDPEAAAETLKQHGGAIPGIEPGEATAAHLDSIVSRSTVIGAFYLALVCLLPAILTGYAAVPFYFGGPSLLIVVCTILDLDAQVRGAWERDPRS
jgi:preprotein translocase subunit SecY